MKAAAPILPSRDLAATADFYARLGFEQTGLWPDEYLIVTRADVGIHFFFAPDIDPGTSIAGCYLYVEDADSVFADFSRLGLPTTGIPRLHGPVETTTYGLREFAVVDPDGNLLRIGSSVADPR